MICSSCKIDKDKSHFSPDKRLKSGCQSKCKPCKAQERKTRYWENPEHHRNLASNWVKNNYSKKLESNSIYRANNLDKVSEWKKLDRLRNKDRINANNAFRRSAIANRSVKWANKSKIKDFYTTANALSMITGVWHHVDHIIPLHGKNVSGLHVENNLQILEAKTNLIKGNSYE